MQESRPLTPPAVDGDWSQRKMLLNRCLLFAALLVAGVAVVFFSLQRSDRFNPSTPQLIGLALGTAWIAATYLLARKQRLQVAGSMFLVLVLAVLVLAVLALPPEAALLLLPLTAVPVALAALLLSRRAVYLSALATLLVSGAALLLPAVLTATPSDPAVDSVVWMALAATGLSLGVLAFILAQLRGTVATLHERAQSSEAATETANQLRQNAEHDRNATFELLRQQDQHFHSVIQHVEDGVIAVDANGRITRANTIAHDIWAEFSESELTGQSLDSVRLALANAAASPYADIIDLPVSSTPLADGYTHILLDRRERARLDRLRSDLIGLLTDEMRNPLTSMVTALDLTLGLRSVPDDVDRVLIGARQSGQRLLELVTTLLEINQIEQNPAVLHWTPVSLCRVLEAGIAQMSPLAQHGAVTIAVEFSNDCTMVLDSERMQRAFVYLLEHALRHSPPYSTVQIRTERQNGAMLVRITDQGPGLTAQQRETLFDRRAGGDDRGGPVLGLAFSKLLIEVHGGRLEVDDNNGQGCVYTFALPVESLRASTYLALPPETGTRVRS